MIKRIIVLAGLVGLGVGVAGVAPALAQTYPLVTTPRLRFVVSSVTTASNGGGTAASATLTTSEVSYIEHTCSDTDGCTLTLSESGAKQGQLLTVVNVSSNTDTFADSSGVQELAGGTSFAAAQWQSIMFQYVTDRWVELNRSGAGEGGGGGGTVTSVALTAPGIFTVAGTPITTSGTITLSFTSQSANTFLAGPTTGAAATPSYRTMVNADLPVCASTKIYKSNGTTMVCDDDAGASSGAPTAAQYVTLATDATLSNERVLTAGNGITLTDAGAGSTITVALNSALTFDQSTPTRKISADNTLTTSSGDQYGHYFRSVFDPGADIAGSAYGLYFEANTDTDAGIDIANLYGLYGAGYNQTPGTTAQQSALVGDVLRQGSGTSTAADAVTTYATTAGTATVTDLRGVHVTTPSKGGSTTITNSYGIDIEDQTVSGTTANWGLRYQAPSSKTFGVKADGTMHVGGADLPSCSNATTSKLLYDTTTKQFSCGTDQSGGSGGWTTVAKTSDTSRASTTSPTDDPDLTFAVDANSHYAFEIWLIMNDASSGTADFKFQWNVPASTSMDWGGLSTTATNSWMIVGTGSVPSALNTVSSVLTQGGGNAAGNTGVMYSGVIHTAGTSGSATWQWSQNTSNGSNVTLKAGSYIRYRKLN